MVGEDKFLLDKKHSYKKKSGKKKETSIDPSNSDGIRRESWLSDEVLAAVRRCRAVMFVCHLRPKAQMTNVEKDKEQEFSRYIEGFDLRSDHSPNARPEKEVVKPSVSEARHGLLEFSQYCNLQFDSVRRAKYSTAMLLYYLQNPESPGVLPACSCCRRDIINVRWHKVSKSFDERRRSSLSIAIRTYTSDMSRRELCEQCFKATAKKEDYVPIRVTFRRTGPTQS